MEKFKPPHRVRRLTVRVRDSKEGLRRMKESSDRGYGAGLKFYKSLKSRNKKCQVVQSVGLIWTIRMILTMMIVIYAMAVVAIAKMIVSIL